MRYIMIIGLLLSSACATTYHPYDMLRGGYLQEDLSGGIYVITFKGNNYTSLNQVVSGAYNRANELAVIHNKHIIEAHLETYVEKHIGYKNINSETCSMMKSTELKEEDISKDNCKIKTYEFEWPVAVLKVVMD